MCAVGEAALGAAFGELLKAVVEATKKSVMFDYILNEIESTLNLIIPVFEEIEAINRKLDLPIEETKHLKILFQEGKKLVIKCSKLKCWSLKCLKRPYYANKLLELSALLSKFLEVLQVQQARDQKRTLQSVNSICDSIKKIEQSSAVQKQAGNWGLHLLPEPPEFTVGLQGPVEELKRKLLRAAVSLLVVSAAGGCGKTTLVKMFCQDKEVKEIFKENIFFFTFSKTPNLRFIVQTLFQHKGHELPELQSDEIAVSHLEIFLRETMPNPILLVLDDVWSGSESLLDRLVLQKSSCKILVTSRFTFPRFGPSYYLKPLNDANAMELFFHFAILKDGNFHIPDDLVKKVVRGCKGFPLALMLVGRSLCGEPASVWRSTEKKWSGSQSIFASNSDLLNSLKSSIDVSCDDIIVKESFMDLGSFPEDQRIPASALVDMWTESYDIDEDDAFTNVHKLSKRNLVTLVIARKYDSSVDDNHYDEHFITQHDLLRELAIHLGSLEPVAQSKRLIVEVRGNNYPDWWAGLKQQPVSAYHLSISTDDLFSSNWLDMEAPQVKVMILNLQSKNYKLPEFIKRMDQLKVLIVTNYGFFHADLKDFHLLGSLLNLRRIRLDRISIPSLCNTTMQLRHLQKITLNMCKIGQAFSNLSCQISEVFPNLSDIHIDYCNDLVTLPDGLCDIPHLKSLSITNCHSLSLLPKNIGKLNNLQVLRLCSCTELLELPETTGDLCNLIFLDITCCLSIRKLPDTIGALGKLRKLHMRQCQSLQKLPQSVKNLVHLNAIICDEEVARLWKYASPNSNNVIKKPEEDINLDWLPNVNF